MLLRSSVLGFAAVFGLSTIASAAEPIVNSLGMKLMPIAAGRFTMGQDSPAADYKMNKHPNRFDEADWDERPAHDVSITKPFLMSATEVTLGQYRKFKPDHLKGRGADDDAATHVSWHDAVAFCEWLDEHDRDPLEIKSIEAPRYRLPTEAEWEYACRAGTTTLFNTGDTLPPKSHGWFGEIGYRERYFTEANASPEYRITKESKPDVRVAQQQPNAWGLFDMHGNVAEWCTDSYAPYGEAARTDPIYVDREADIRVIRGGSHTMFTRMLRSANRSAWLPDAKNAKVGFRVVKGAPDFTGSLGEIVCRLRELAPALPVVPFRGPTPFVKVPADAYGPMFSWHNHSPAIVACKNGDLLAVWYSTVDEGGTELCNLASRLPLGSTEWTPAMPFWDGPDVNDHAPKLWVDDQGNIFHFARGWTENIVRTSTDDGHTWSQARIMPTYGEFGNQPIRTKDGTLILTHDGQETSLVTSRDGGQTWLAPNLKGRVAKETANDFRPGGRGVRHAGIHAPIVELNDGRLMTVGRWPKLEDQARFDLKTPISYSSDGGATWTYEASPFNVISSVQRDVLMRLAEGPLLWCTFTDERRLWDERKGMKFAAVDAAGKPTEFTGYGLFAALSFDEGKTWPVRKLITPGGPTREVPGIDRLKFTLSETMAEPSGYLTACQTKDGTIQLLTSKNHYAFTLAWLKELPKLAAQTK